MAATKRRADFTNVKEGGVFRPRRKPEGEYAAKVVKVDDHKFKDETKEGWVFTVMIDGDARSTYPVYASTNENELWKVRKMFIAAGIAVPKRAVMVDPNKLVNKKIGVYLVDDEYEGRLKSTIEDFIPIDEVSPNGDDPDDDDGYEDEEEVKPARRGSKKRQPEPEPDEDDDDEDEDEPRKRTAKKATRRRAPEDDEDDEDDEEPEPPRRRKSTKSTAKRRRPPADDDDDEDLELDEL